MQLSISGRRIDVTDALKAYVTGKLTKLERHYDHITNIHVVLVVEKLSHKAEATAHLSGAELFAEAVSEDLYAAIDLLVDKLDRQVIKHKEKVMDRHHGRGSTRA